MLNPDEPTKRSGAVDWRDRPLQPLPVAADIAGLSPTTIRRLAAEGKLTLKRLAGRTMVETVGLVALINNAERWTPSHRADAARHARRVQQAGGAR